MMQTSFDILLTPPPSNCARHHPPTQLKRPIVQPSTKEQRMIMISCKQTSTSSSFFHLQIVPDIILQYNRKDPSYSVVQKKENDNDIMKNKLRHPPHHFHRQWTVVASHFHSDSFTTKATASPLPGSRYNLVAFWSRFPKLQSRRPLCHRLVGEPTVELCQCSLRSGRLGLFASCRVHSTHNMVLRSRSIFWRAVYVSRKLRDRGRGSTIASLLRPVPLGISIRETSMLGEW